MAEIIKVLGQSAPSATTENDLYTVPSYSTAVTSCLTVCNRNASAGTFRAYVSVGGGAAANKDYLYYDHAINGNDTINLVIPMTLSEGDIVRVYASNGDHSFNLFGVETLREQT